MLLADCLNVDRSWFYAWPDKTLQPLQAEQFQLAVARRLQGEPVAYITGHREFWSLRFKVNRDTLVPRPDTELLVEHALQLLDHCDSAPNRVLDLGTGSGAIAIAIALERPDAIVHASDNSAGALAVAIENANALGADVTFFQSDWLQAIPAQRYDLVVSNPPYIDPCDAHLARLCHEPQQALVAADHGFADIARIIADAPAYLCHSGWLMLEHGAEQGKQTRAQLQHAGYLNIETLSDLEQRERVTRGQHMADGNGRS